MRIHQVIVNLVSNAVRFSYESGVVELSAKWDPDKGVDIFVKDFGLGIHPDHQAEVMEPFTQVAEAYKRGHGGNGLGLAISNALMKMHAGTLSIESSPGEGTLVTAHLPASRIEKLEA